MGPTKLAHFDVEPSGEGFAIRIEDARGTVHDLVVTRDQLDVMADLIEDALLSDAAPDADR